MNPVLSAWWRAYRWQLLLTVIANVVTWSGILRLDHLLHAAWFIAAPELPGVSTSIYTLLAMTLVIAWIADADQIRQRVVKGES